MDKTLKDDIDEILGNHDSNLFHDLVLKKDTTDYKDSANVQILIDNFIMGICKDIIGNQYIVTYDPLVIKFVINAFLHISNLINVQYGNCWYGAIVILHVIKMVCPMMLIFCNYIIAYAGTKKINFHGAKNLKLVKGIIDFKKDIIDGCDKLISSGVISGYVDTEILQQYMRNFK